MSYTTYAAPKQSITGDKYGYVAHFIPRERAMWEGHLRRYLLGDDGSFPANIDSATDEVIVRWSADRFFSMGCGGHIEKPHHGAHGVHQHTEWERLVADPHRFHGQFCWRC